MWPDLNPDSEAAYYFEQGLESYLRGDDEREDEVVCRYCKRGPFYWAQTENGWRLSTATGRIHRCKAYALSASHTCDSLSLSKEPSQ